MVLTNNLQWKAELLKLAETTDDNDRAVVAKEKIRTIFYADLGITAQEKYLSKQAKTDVVRRIKIRLDMSVQEKINGIRIADTDYKIERIFINTNKREMELSLNYVD